MSRAARDSSITVIGAGLCGSLLAVLLARRGYRVSLIERRADPRHSPPAVGRSINLAMSARGIRALKHAGLFEAVESLLLPMRGRLLHEENGATELLPYGQREGELIWSVSRAELNRRLIEAADRLPGVTLRFGQEALAWDGGRGALTLRDIDEDRRYEVAVGPVIAADGAGSAVRRSLAAAGIVRADESLLAHGYKELAVPAGPGVPRSVATSSGLPSIGPTGPEYVPPTADPPGTVTPGIAGLAPQLSYPLMLPEVPDLTIPFKLVIAPFRSKDAGVHRA